MPKTRVLIAIVAVVFGISMVTLYRSRGLIYDVLYPSPIIGAKAPKIELIDNHKNIIELSQFKGKTVYLHFMASWCHDCVNELPKLQSYYNREKANSDIVFLNVPFHEDEYVTKKFLQKKGYTLPVYADPEGATAKEYGIKGIPTTMIINKNGQVKKIILGVGKW